jgi:hypothetical protein
LARRNTQTDYNPQQLLQLYQMGLLRGADVDMLMARMQPDKDALVRQAQIAAMASGITAPGVNQGQANVGMNIPLGANSTLAPSLMAKYTRADDGKPQMTFTPQMALELQNARANISNKGYGGEIDLGPLTVNYQRERYKGDQPTNVYGINIPLSNEATIGGNIRQAAGRPNTYQANINFPFAPDANTNAALWAPPPRPTDPLANVPLPNTKDSAWAIQNNFGLTADMTPAEKAYVLYANYRRSF